MGGHEKIDIIQWNPDEKLYLISALSPAKISDVILDKDHQRARVLVDSEQAALAIGKGGINVDLASKLTGYTIDIEEIAEKKDSTEKNDDKKEEKKDTSVDNSTPLTLTEPTSTEETSPTVDKS